jgi:hypothetical protein
VEEEGIEEEEEEEEEEEKEEEEEEEEEEERGRRRRKRRKAGLIRRASPAKKAALPSNTHASADVSSSARASLHQGLTVANFSVQRKHIFMDALGGDFRQLGMGLVVQGRGRFR